MRNEDLNNAGKQGLEAAENAGLKLTKSVKSILKRGRGGRGGIVQRVAALIKRILKAILKAIIALIKLLGPWVLVLIAAAVLLGGIFYYFIEERGTESAFSQDPQKQNITVTSVKETKDGKQYTVETAVALTKEQAYNAAFYNYMSLQSYSKLVNGVDGVLTFRDNTADFANLEDYAQKEKSFYLAPQFIKMLDETLHNGEFMYPEQFVKPIPYSQDATGHLKLINLYNREEGATPVRNLDVTSKELDVRTGYRSTTGNDVPGVWDYGFGSVIKYGVGIRDHYIKCQYQNVTVDVDLDIKAHQETYKKLEYFPPETHTDPETGETVVDYEGGYEYVDVTVDVPASQHHLNIDTINVSGITSQSEIRSLFRAAVKNLEDKYLDDVEKDKTGFPRYNDEDFIAACTIIVNLPQNAEETITKLISEQDHIGLNLSASDKKIGQRAFKDPTLQANFGNNTGVYPIKVPLIESVAFFSGDIAYEIKSSSQEDDLEIVEDSKTMKTIGLSVDELSDPKKKIDRIYLGTLNCVLREEEVEGFTDDTVLSDSFSGGTGHAWITREGKVINVMPYSQQKEKNSVGFDYIQDYATLYENYIPEIVESDTDFEKRINTILADENGDTINEFMSAIGLLMPLNAAVSDGANYDPWTPSNLPAKAFKEILEDVYEKNGKSLTHISETEYPIEAEHMEEWPEALEYLETEYGINALFALALMQNEKGMGCADNYPHPNPDGTLAYFNPFDVSRSSTSDGKNNYAAYSDPFDAVDHWAELLHSSLYFGKSIDGIFNSGYAGEGEAEGTISNVKKFMGSLYTFAIQKEYDPDISLYTGRKRSDDESITKEDIELAIQKSGYKKSELYANVSFDTITATHTLQMFQTKDPSKSVIGKLLEDLGKTVSGFIDSLVDGFKAEIGYILPILPDTSVYDGSRFRFKVLYNENDVDDIVYQAVALASGITYTEAKESVMEKLNSNVDNFLFLNNIGLRRVRALLADGEFNLMGIDIAAPISETSADLLIQNGFSFVVRYIGPFTWSKCIQPDELNMLREKGLAVMFVYEVDTNSVLGGYPAGAAHAIDATAAAEQLGLPAGTAIYYAIDYGARPGEYPIIMEYFNGVRENTGDYTIGVYAGFDPIEFLYEEGACEHFWQAYAWGTAYGAISEHINAHQFLPEAAQESKDTALAVGLGGVDLNRSNDLEAAGMYLP